MPLSSDRHLHQLSQQLATLLTETNRQLSTAESCTGGWLAKCCTDIPGSSRWFKGGFIPYSNQAKETQLGVARQTLLDFGAVSKQTVMEMAQATQEKCDSDTAIAISGIAGPDGGTETKPVGLVWFALANRKSAASAYQARFDGDRELIRRQAVAFALTLIIKNARALS